MPKFCEHFADASYRKRFWLSSNIKSIVHTKNVVANRDIAFFKVISAHELGHQFGLAGDNPGTLFKIMDYPNYDAGVNSPDIGFHPEHINIMRRRIESPGQP